ncbi:hypothetical protein [Streptomyces sp. JW3]|uniref:hypothetical protein n=1 Tax=Streptomyces sp. JW3 TaxID=3456955 RepID=UPI003FA41F06
MHTAVRRALLLAPVLALAAGCGTGAGPHPADPPPTASALATGDPRFQPLDAYEMSEDDTRTVTRARWTLAKECMRGLGFTELRELSLDPVPAWPERPAGTGAVTAFAHDSAERYGVEDPGEAAEYGYQGARYAYERHTARREWTLDEYLGLAGPDLPGDARSVHGHRIPEDGCLGRAARTLFGTDPAKRTDPVLSLKADSLREAEQDPAWRAADRAWSACMREAGHDYATPGDARDDPDPGRVDRELRDRLAGRPVRAGEPSAREKQTATADARCKRRTGYLRAVHAVDVRVQQRLAAEHREELAERRDWEAKAVRAARDLLDGH